jgi:hypothetical protein
VWSSAEAGGATVPTLRLISNTSSPPLGSLQRALQFRPKLPSGEMDRSEEFSIGELLTWWDHFFEFDRCETVLLSVS